VISKLLALKKLYLFAIYILLPYSTGHKHHLRAQVKGLSLPYLAAGSNVKNEWDLRRNKNNTSVDNFYYSYSRLI
jgi:hypothetical protein